MGYGPPATAMMAGRTAKQHASFLLPHLKPDMAVLDCGCGPGSVTIGLAEAVAPGHAVGTDVEESQLEIGRASAGRNGVANVRFEVASAYELPFLDESFDAIFISAVMGNLREPLRGLSEARRVLKPGGVIAVKEFDHGGDLLYPVTADLLEGVELYYRLRRHNGHDPDSGRKVPNHLNAAGFRDVTIRATYETFSGPNVLPQFGNGFAALVTEAFAEPLLQLGWVTSERMQGITRAWEEFPKQPGAFYALAWCEALGWK